MDKEIQILQRKIRLDPENKSLKIKLGSLLKRVNLPYFSYQEGYDWEEDSPIKEIKLLKERILPEKDNPNFYQYRVAARKIETRRGQEPAWRTEWAVYEASDGYQYLFIKDKSPHYYSDPMGFFGFTAWIANEIGRNFNLRIKKENWTIVEDNRKDSFGFQAAPAWREIMTMSEFKKRKDEYDATYTDWVDGSVDYKYTTTTPMYSAQISYGPGLFGYDNPEETENSDWATPSESKGKALYNALKEKMVGQNQEIFFGFDEFHLAWNYNVVRSKELDGKDLPRWLDMYYFPKEDSNSSFKKAVSFSPNWIMKLPIPFSWDLYDDGFPDVELTGDMDNY